MLDADRLTPATPEDLADALASALQRAKAHPRLEIMARIVAERLVGRPRGQAPAYRA